MLATDMTASGSPEEKLRWAFKMYDKDGSGCKDYVCLMLILLFMVMLIGFKMYDKDGSGCPDCTVDVGVAVQIDINVGVIADRKASMLKLMLVLLRILLLMLKQFRNL